MPPVPVPTGPAVPTPSETIQKERLNPAFDLRRMTYALGGGQKSALVCSLYRSGLEGWLREGRRTSGGGEGAERRGLERVLCTPCASPVGASESDLERCGARKTSSPLMRNVEWGLALR